MQKLVYEPAWDKQISDKDRNLVEETFKNTSLTENPIQFTSLRMDWNYKEELLMMVIIHNVTDKAISFNKKKLRLTHNNVIVAEHLFNLPNLTITSKTSMPWTFIFPTGSWVDHEDFRQGELELAE